MLSIYIYIYIYIYIIKCTWIVYIYMHYMYIYALVSKHIQLKSSQFDHLGGQKRPKDFVHEGQSHTNMHLYTCLSVHARRHTQYIRDTYIHTHRLFAWTAICITSAEVVAPKPLRLHNHVWHVNIHTACMYVCVYMRTHV